MSPPGNDHRPGGNRAADEQTGDGESLDVTVLDGTDVRDPFVLGYRLGYAAGVDVGRGQLEAEYAADWHDLFLHVRRELAQPTFAELQRRRGDPPPKPCHRRCGACTNCLRHARLTP